MRASLARMSFAIVVWLAASACFDRDSVVPPSDDDPPAEAPAENLETLVPEIVDAIQAKLPAFVMEHVAASFKSDDGLDYFGVRALVDTEAFRDDEVGARLESLTIAKQDDGRQRVLARVAFAAGHRLAPGAALPPGAVTYAFDLIFALDDGKWRAVSGSYRRE